jgi:endonuclease/exonuclease/phosphatase (EEP) superfamily protein YafD
MKIKKLLFIIFYSIAIILTICTILSIFRNVDFRYFKMLDFPRIQLFVASLLCILILLIVVKKWKWYNYLLAFGLFSGLCINAFFIINYTTIVPVTVPWLTALESSENQISILLTNVKMTNRKAETLLDLIEQKKPDLILAMEVDEWWNEKLSTLKSEYPYTQQAINEVTYGMVLYSKLPIQKVEVEYLNNKKVPSFESTISLSSGKKISFHAIHPVPPTYFKDLPDNEGQQEEALKKLGNEITNRYYPTIIAGDVNDVVWAQVDALTGTENILFDVRVGRGFYNSFNAHNPLMRWPLDHVFVTKEFKLKSLERLPKIGSDHFPIFVELAL